MHDIYTWLQENAVKRQSPIEGDAGLIWVTKERGDYITRVGMEDKMSFLINYEIDEHLASTWEPGKPVNIGFSSKRQKWYGWSHRAICGFGIGSEVKKGDCAYVGASPEDLIEDRVLFFSDLGEDKAKQVRDECQILPDRSGIRILHAPMIVPVYKSMEDALSDDATPEIIDIAKDAFSIRKCGRGEWKAETLDDAKQMAMDFAESVS